MSFAYASLCIYSETISADEVSKALSAKPSTAWSKGDRFPSGGRVRTQNGWVLDSTAGTEVDVEEHIRELAVFVSSRADALNRLICSGDVSVNILCSYGDDDNYHYGLSLDHDVMSALATVQISLGLDCIYPRPAESR